ncbi:hypothetical protein [Hahella ganghwensis]|uniref:hypothetical protein n=1 Tax=Hahella ganghwensis TaxID=286420 RepID=UPI0003A6EE97|nr:hypothetical protein [Hahella ganghwensis]
MMKHYFCPSDQGFYMEGVHEPGEIPADAVEITSAEYERLLEGQGNLQKIQADDQGQPCLVRPPAPILRRLAKQRIDEAAGEARARYVSAGQYLDEEYRLVLQQVEIWNTQGRPADQVPASIQVWAEAAGLTATNAADNIEATAEAWHSLLLQIRAFRLTGKAALDAADEDEDFETLAQPYIDQLAALRPGESL